MMQLLAIKCKTIFDGYKDHKNSALLVNGDTVVEIVEEDEIPDRYETIELSGGLLCPGFIDLQVNGGGGILFNDNTNAEALKTICEAHIKFGTTSLLPTLITDTPEITASALKAGIEAIEKNVPGVIGLHLEGPHLSIAKRGAHKESLVREMAENDREELINAKRKLPYLMSTVAPEGVTNEQIATLKDAGIVVSLGHTNASCKQAQLAEKAGARCVTHLFNGMSGFDHRDPGVAGAALQSEKMYAGLIADFIHVDPMAISIALKAKKQGKIFLVTDAMATIGTDIKSFELNGRLILRENGQLRLESGGLAGADLDMITAVKNMSELVSMEEAIRMASLYPAQAIGADEKLGHLKPGAYANIIHLNEEFDVEKVWVKGKIMSS